MMTTAWRLGAHPATGNPRLRKWAHMLGYGGHFLTKSRRYSVSFGQLRRARTEHRRQLILENWPTTAPDMRPRQPPNSRSPRPPALATTAMPTAPPEPADSTEGGAMCT
jgi:hypothetical protein